MFGPRDDLDPLLNRAMARILHILTHADDALARDVIARQQASPENQVEARDIVEEEVDYRGLLEDIFKADSIQVW